MPPYKTAVVDKYAEIALFDAAENQRVILEAQEVQKRKKLEMKRALDAQVRMKEEALLKEREEDLEWVKKEQERIKIWNEEERQKIADVKGKEESIRKQREQQLRELALLREREKKEQQEYDIGILKSIHKEIKQERAAENEKRVRDAANLRQVAEQNVEHMEHLKLAKTQEIENVRALEAQWSEMLNKQERQRDRSLKQTYARQARQYAASESMQETMDRIAAQDEARATRHAKELDEAAAKRERDQRDTRARLQQETLDVLAIQVREKQVRANADAERERMVVAREKEDIARAEAADGKRRANQKTRNSEYARELNEQMCVQEQRKTLEPFLMSKAERQMNAALLRRLPAD